MAEPARQVNSILNARKAYFVQPNRDSSKVNGLMNRTMKNFQTELGKIL